MYEDPETLDLPGSGTFRLMGRDLFEGDSDVLIAQIVGDDSVDVVGASSSGLTGCCRATACY